MRKASLALAVLWAARAAAGEDGEARPSELVERARARLAQVQISVSGRPDVIASLEPDDLLLKVHLRRITSFTLDRFCGNAGPGDGPAVEPVRVSHLLYFDQPHLTLPGRQRALDVARQLVPLLVRDGSRAMIVSNAARLAIVEPLTEDPALLLAALERLEHDRTQWDAFAAQEDSRVAEVVEALNDDATVYRAIATARSHQREERLRAERDLHRLAVAVGQLADSAPPAAVIYFADTMRSNAGEHYLEFFGSSLRATDPALGAIATGALTGSLAFDRVVDEASAHGVRFFTIQARGLTTPFDTVVPNPSALTITGTVPSSSHVRSRDAQNTLDHLASETGGRAFLRGTSGARIAEAIRADFACLYVASFDPEGLPLDAPLRVVVEPRRDGLELRARGRILIPSERREVASRLLNAFALAREEAALELRTGLVPTGFDRGEYTALLQISVPGTGLPSATWDLGASLVHREELAEEVSARLSIDRAGLPLVLEREIRLRPGPHEVIAVAHEPAAGLVLSDHLELDWPDPGRQPASCAPISLLQPAAGAFVRGERTRKRGSLVRPPRSAVDPGRPLALASLVCAAGRRTLVVERSLLGGADVEFEPLELEPKPGEPCAQIRDLIGAGAIAPGSHAYEVRVLGDGQLLARRELRFLVAPPGG
jgi:VWFA-related protein